MIANGDHLSVTCGIPEVWVKKTNPSLNLDMIIIQKHLSDNSLLETHQSAYRKDHSTETAVLSVLNGLLLNADERFVSLKGHT